MNDTNYIGGIVKILEIPKQKVLNNDIIVATFRAQLPQVRQSKIVHLKFLGNLAKDITNYYKVNDYVLIEGYLSLRNTQISNTTVSFSKKVEITVLKVHPFFLHYDL
jgi:hypothetical protein